MDNEERRPSILIVEDESIIRLHMHQMLEENGHTVLDNAKDGQEAVEKAKALKPDLILMDLILPKDDGIKATKIILDALPETVIIVVSALQTKEVIREAREAGATDYIVKPFEDDELLATIKSCYPPESD